MDTMEGTMEGILGNVPVDLDGFGGIAVSATEHIILEEGSYNYCRSRKNFTSWLVVNGTTVGMIRFLIGGDEVPYICDIEIRKEFRGHKLSHRFIALLEEFIVGGKLYTTGHYTPEGFRSLSGLVPLSPSSIESRTEAKPYFGSMDFVASWENFYTKH